MADFTKILANADFVKSEKPSNRQREPIFWEKHVDFVWGPDIEHEARFVRRPSSVQVDVVEAGDAEVRAKGCTVAHLGGTTVALVTPFGGRPHCSCAQSGCLMPPQICCGLPPPPPHPPKGLMAAFATTLKLPPPNLQHVQIF